MGTAGLRARSALRVVRWALACVAAMSVIPSLGSAAVPADAARSSYDDAGRLRSFTAPDAAGGTRAPREAAVFEWDAVGNLLSVDRYLVTELSVIGATPASGQVGDTVTITGTGFGDVPRDLVVRFAGTSATVLAAADEELQVEVPSGASSGTITVERGLDSATSAESFTVESDAAPHISGVTPSPAVVRAGDQLTIAGDHFAAAKAENDVKLNGVRSRIVSARASEIVVETPATGSGRLSVETPDGSAVGPDAFVVPSAYATTDVVDTGRITLGTGRSVTLSAAGKIAMFVVDARANDIISTALASSTMSGTVSVWSPAGTQLGSSSYSTGTSTTPSVQLPTDGTYTVLVRATSAGSATLVSFVDSIDTISPSSSGDTKTVRAAWPGQDARLRFDGRAGQRIAVRVASNTFPSGYVAPARAGTTNYAVWGGWATLASGWLDPITLPSDGSWDVWLESTGASGGAATLTVYDVPADIRDTIALSSTPATRDLRFDYAGQNAVLSFDGRAGQRMELRFPTIGLSEFTAQVLNTGGSVMATSSWTSSSRGFMEVVLPSDGTYQLVVNPTKANTGSATAEVVDASDVIDTISPSSSGDTKTVRAAWPGQDARLRFDGRAGQRIAVRVASNTFPSGYVAPARAGTTNYAVWGGWATLASGWLDPITLPSDGSWDVWLESTGASGGAATLTVYDVPADQRETVTLSSTSLTRDIRIDYAGQRAQLLFEGRSGQTLSTSLSSSTLSNATLSYLRPDGGTLSSWSFGTSAARQSATLNATGTHKIQVDPAGALTGSVSLLALLTDDGRTLGFSGGGTREKDGFLRVPTPAPAPSQAPAADDEPRTSIGQTEPASQPAAHTDAPSPPAGGARVSRTSSGQHGSKPKARRSRGTRRHSRRRTIGRAGPTRRVTTRRGATARKAATRQTAAQRARHGRKVARGRHVVRAGDRRARARTHAAHQRHVIRTLQSWRSPVAPTWRPTRADRRGPWTADAPPTPWTRLVPLTAEPATTTALAGQVLRVDGTPLRGVEVFIEGTRRSDRTDRTGRFLLTRLQPGRRVLVVDGREVGAHGYGVYEMRVALAEEQTTILPYTVWLTALDRAGDQRVDVPTTGETVLTNPRIPGLEVHLPSGSRITGADGRVVRDLNLTALPVDRPPFPLPEGVVVPAYFTAQPGGAYLSKGARIIYPNYHHLPPGQRVAFWNYDADDRGWYIYGYGEVTRDARQVVPDPGVRIWEFTGAMASTGAPAPASGPGAGGGASGGDPVDLGTGLFVYEKTDLVLPDAIPATAKRTYRPADTNIYTFGRGTTSSYDLRLMSVTNYTVAQLVLPNGGTVRFERTSPGTDWATAVYAARTTPGPWFGSVIRRTADSSGWDLLRRDGTLYEFDSGFGPVTMIRDRDGNQLTVTRSQGSYGNALQVTTPNGRWLRFSYDRYNRATEAVDNAGRRVSYTYNADSRLETVTDADGGVSTFTYDTAGQMTAIEDARGTTFLQNTYDASGRVVEQTLGNRGLYRFDYTLDASRRVTSTAVTDPLGMVQEVDFDANGLPVQGTVAAGTASEQVTRYERNASTNLVEAIVDPLGNRTEIAYDADANITEVTRLADTADAVTTRYTYGSESRPLTRTDPLGKTTRYDYDSAGRLTSITDPTSRTTTIGYTGASRKPAWIDHAGNETQLTYAGGDLRSIRDPLGRVTTRWVDSAGRVSAVTDPLGRTTRVSYSDGNLLTSHVDPRGGTTTYDHDANGNLTTVTDARGKTMRATYDTLDDLVSWTDGNGRTETIERDLGGSVVKVTDRNGQVTTLRYDELGQRTFAGFGTTGSPGSETYDSTIDYAYDDRGRLIELDDSQTGVIANAFDGLNRLTSQTTPNGEVEYSWDDAGRRASLSLDSSSLAAYAYDDAGRLTSIAQAGQLVELGYDRAGRPDTLELPNGIVRQTFYDAASQITRSEFVLATTTIGDVQYAYDEAGRRAATWGTLAKFRLPAELRSTTYDDANRRTAQDSTTLTWDLNGNLTDDSTRTYTWDSRNQLTTVRDGTDTASFTYDPLGRRSSWDIDSVQRGFVYDGWNVLKEDDASTDATLVNGLGLDQVFSRTVGSTTRTVLADLLGSTVALTDDTGAITDEFAYGPFGESDTSTTDHPYQYTGRENDGTGLLHYRNRYYSPELKRFISEDPTGMAGSGTNYYAYVGNDPFGFTDPTGLFWEEVAGGIDSVVPDPVSEVSAGILDGTLAGIPSRAFGIPQECWGSAHAWGQIGGAAAGAFVAGGAVTWGARGAMGAANAGALGGAAGGAYNAAGNNINADASEIATGAASGVPGGMAGGIFSSVGRTASNADTVIAANVGGTISSQGFDYSIAHGTGQPMTVTVGSKDDC